MSNDKTECRSIGLVLVRPTQLLGSEPFYQELMAGLDQVLLPRGYYLLLQIVPTKQEEIQVYDRWAEAGSVAGVILVDLEEHDDRVPHLTRLGLPAVILGDPSTSASFPAVWTDDASAMREAVTLLAGLGHTRIGRVSGPNPLAHTRIRAQAFREVADSLGVTAFDVDSDYTEEGGHEATRRLLMENPWPSAIIFDDDLMALGGLAAAAEAGLGVPRDISIVAWDDSALCQLASPTLTVMGHDVQAIGEISARAMLDLLAGIAAPTYEAPKAEFISRESLARPVA